MLFRDFAAKLATLETVSSRLTMTELLADLYRQLDDQERLLASYLLEGQLLPPYESKEFQVAVKTVIKALARILPAEAVEADTGASGGLFDEQSFDQAEALVTREYKAKGDLGQVTQWAMGQGERTAGQLTVVQVYEALTAIAQEHGAGSQERKLEGVVKLLRQVDPVSAKFIVRIILGRLRLGFSTMTMIDALSWAATGTKEESKLLELAYQKKADIAKLAQTYLKHTKPEERRRALENYTVEVGVPIVPALCQRLNTYQEIIAKMNTVIAEPKFDGLRVQIHIMKDGQKNEDDSPVRTFTRNLEETSHMFPELQAALDQVDCQSCILDAEAIGFDPQTGELLPFQATITRKRKHEVAETAQNVPIRFYVFDVLALNGKGLLDQKLRDRKDLLKDIITENEVFYLAPYIITTDADELRTFHEAQLAAGLEGAVMKQIDSPYQPGRKGWSWVKIKESEGNRGKLKDTLDCVVMGHYAGRGKRTQFGVGAFLVGVLDGKDEVKTIAKIGTGLSDEQFRELYQRCQPLVTPDQPKNFAVNKALVPDVWVQPGLVVEIAADEITKSPTHTAGQALRFPRLVRFRDDKDWSNITTVAELEGIK